MTIYEEIAQERDFIDRFQQGGAGEGIDVLIPLLHSTPFWNSNLLSYYREIPVRRLLIGDAGSIDGSVEIAKKFPRVVIYDHTPIRTLGKSIANLISRVESEHFAYLQSDTYLPEGWFDSMWIRRESFDWYGCVEQPVIVLSAPLKDYSGTRPLAGTQIGRTAVFNGLDSIIQDDYGYRQEDFILEEVVLKNGGNVGGVTDVFHVHQTTERKTVGRQINVKKITIELNEEADDARVLATQLYGLVKYCNPRRPTVFQEAARALSVVVGSKSAGVPEVLNFVKTNNREWSRFMFRLYIIAYAKVYRRRIMQLVLRSGLTQS